MARFYKCNNCGNLINFINAIKEPVSCCGEKMMPLEAKVEHNTTNFTPVIKE